MEVTVTITTRNRLRELKETLNSLSSLIENSVKVILCDDASTDGTSEFVKKEYPTIQLLVNSENKGLIYSRNLLMRQVKTPYAISLDDDANFLSKNALHSTITHFKQYPGCGVVAFRIYWGRKEPVIEQNEEKSHRVKGFVGCGHAWRMKAWNHIPNYPEWFVFYGEEQFASYHLFKKGWEVHYVPSIVVQHRVDIKARKKNRDYRLRLRRSLRSGWYLYMMFYPWRRIPKRFFYTLWVQLKLKVFKGDFNAAMAILAAFIDVVVNFHRLLKNSNRLNNKEFEEFNHLLETKIYGS